MNTKTKVNLLVIDPQNDFCDIPDDFLPKREVNGKLEVASRPALPVAGAHQDMLNLADFINRVGRRLNDIQITLDSHNIVDIAHPIWWVDQAGNSPNPFTVISVDDVVKGVWRARNPAYQAKSLDYVKALATNGRYVLVIWPEHCIISTWGHNVHYAVADAVTQWARQEFATPYYVTKGSNIFTEHYSAVQAEVPDAGDDSTMFNHPFVTQVDACDLILVAGEALSHCVANTVRDMMKNFTKESIEKMVILADCTSNVTGFEQLGEDFLTEFTQAGGKVMTTHEVIATYF